MKKYKNTLIFTGIILSLILCIFLVKSILLPFIIAFILAYLLNPLASFFKPKIGKSGGACIAVLTFFLGIFSFFLVVIPLVQAQVIRFSIKIPSYVRHIWKKLESLITLLKEHVPEEQVRQQLYKLSYTLSSVFDHASSFILKFISNGIAFFTIISLLFIVPIVLFYLLKDWDSLTSNIKKLIPKRFLNSTQQILHEIDVNLSGFVRGQISVCMVLAIFYSIGLSLTGLDLGLLVGIIIGFLSIIPYFGFLFGLILSIILAALQNASLTLWLSIAGVFAAGQVLDAIFITPHFLGKNIGLHPVWIMFSLLAGGAIAGFTGVLLAIPLACIIKVLCHHLIKAYKDSTLYKS